MLASRPLSCCGMPSLKSFKLMFREAPDQLGCHKMPAGYAAVYCTLYNQASKNVWLPSTNWQTSPEIQ